MGRWGSKIQSLPSCYQASLSCLAVVGGAGVTSYIVQMERVEGELLPPLSWLFPLGFFSSV